MKIYAITKGEYSDYHICALTTSKSKAEKLQKIYSDTCFDACIEEFEDGDGEELRILWFCNADGTNPRICDYIDKEMVGVDRHGRIYGVYLFAKDAKHAEKKAHDMLARYKAELLGL